MTKKRAKKITRKAAKKKAAKAVAVPAAATISQPTVTDLLAQSRQAHQEYRDNVPRMHSAAPGAVKAAQVDGDAITAGDALWLACRLRVEAHALDPTLSDPAWQDEAVSHDHDALLEFYAKQLSS